MFPTSETPGRRGEWQQLSDAFGLCIPVADLQTPSHQLALALRLGEHRPFYLERDEDALARKHLREHRGLLVIGRPLSGKTRLALEAMRAVVPDGILLRPSGPERLAKLDALVVPRVRIGEEEKQPSLVLFLDDIDRFHDAPLDDLIDRLYHQVSPLYVVGTCRSGEFPRVLASAALKTLRSGPLSPDRAVEIRPLTRKQAMEVEQEVWKSAPGKDLGIDRTEVGVILKGTKILEFSYGNRTEEERGFLRGVALAECVALPCPKDLVQRIVEEVIHKRPNPAFETTLAGLVKADVLQRDGLSRLSLANHYHRDEIHKAHYSSLAVLREDLRQVESLLKEKGDAASLTALAVYYGDRLIDLAEARRILESSLQTVRHADTLSVLSLVLARSGDEVAAGRILEEALTALSEPERQANLLIRVADEWLRRGANPMAVSLYERARTLAQLEPTRLASGCRAGDALFSQNLFEKAEAAYRGVLGTPSIAENPIVRGRLIVSIFGQNDLDRAANELRGLYRGRPAEFQYSLAAAILQDGEPRFRLDGRLGAIRNLVFEALRDATDAGTRSRELLNFATDLLFRGFLSASKLAFSELRKIEPGLPLDPPGRALMLSNLATSHLFLGETGEARPLFLEALSMHRNLPGTQEYFLAGAEEGIARCDLLEGQLQAARKRYEELLQSGKSAGNDTIKTWAHAGLADLAWKEGNAPQALEHFLALRTLPASFHTFVHYDLGLARAYLHFRRVDDADVHIARGLSSASFRLDYAKACEDFVKLQRESAALRAGGAGAASTVPKRRERDALIMKGGGVKGLAFAGAIRELEPYFEFKAFVGTSAGAVAAALLGAGATGAELETTLREKSFRDFLDGSLWKAPFTIWFVRGVHPGVTFMDWLQDQVSKYLRRQGSGDVMLPELRKRVVVYATRKGSGEVTFDSQGERKDSAVHHAVRCSMSIPYFFQPQVIDNRRAYDGGLLHNYPVEIFLNGEKEKHPPPTFVALYLGPNRPESLKPVSVFSDLLSILLERNDAKVVRKYIDSTVIIDPEPVGTVDFDLTADDKDFLVLAGKAAALEFLNERGLLDPSRVPVVKQTRIDAEAAREKVRSVRRKQQSRKRARARLIAIVILLAALTLWYLRR